MSLNNKKKVHPIVERALNLFYEGYNCLELDDFAVEQLEDSLKEYFGKAELAGAVVALLDLARALDEQGSKSAAIKIIQIAVTASDALEELNKNKMR
ncbi:MAG: hypothetical protein ACFFAN_19080 [Promethearchaeota archaeon]